MYASLPPPMTSKAHVCGQEFRCLKEQWQVLLGMHPGEKCRARSPVFVAPW